MDNIAQLRFLEHKFIDTTIKIDPSKAIDGKMQFKIESQAMDSEADNHMRLDVTVTVFDDAKAVDIKVTASAIFEYDKELSVDSKNNFFKYNAPAIVYPFIRAYINSLTALSGIKPIVLPTLNFWSNK